MPFNIESFKANISGEGYLKNHSYEVFIAPPSSINTNFIGNGYSDLSTIDVANTLKFRTTRISIPGVEIKTVNARRYGIGPLQKYSLTNEFVELKMEILCDRFGGIYQFWYHWFRTIFEFSGNSDALSGNINTFPAYINAYKGDISTTVIIVVYDQEGHAVMRYDFIEAYPVALSDSMYSWQDGGLTQLAISMNYKEFRVINSTIKNVRENSLLNT